VEGKGEEKEKGEEKTTTRRRRRRSRIGEGKEDIEKKRR
jgi:hypothetical protein